MAKGVNVQIGSRVHLWILFFMLIMSMSPNFCSAFSPNSRAGLRNAINTCPTATFFRSSVPRDVRMFASKVAVLGAAGGIGQPLSLLLKQNPLVGDLALYDIFGTEGTAADLSHIDSASTVTGHVGKEELDAALKGADHVVIPAGMPRKPGMTRDDLFDKNANIVKELAEGVARNCPNAFVSVVSNPVNSMVPIVAKVLNKAGVYNPKKLAGVTYLDVQRANTFVAQVKGLDPTKLDVPVIGGHAGTTIVPLLSQIKGVEFTQEELESLTRRIQFGGDEVVKEKGKGYGGSATLSMASAAAHFVNRVMEAEAGKEDVVMCAFVASDLVPNTDFFASPLKFGPGGVEEIIDTPLNEYEQGMFDSMIGDLRAQIKKGNEFEV